MRILDFSDGFESATEPTVVGYPASSVSVTPSGNLGSTNAQAALVELQGDIDAHLVDAVDAHDASAISNVPAGNLASTTVQAALNELQGDVDSIDTAIDDHIADSDAAHQAYAIANTPSGNLVATDVQDALDEHQGDIDTLNTAMSNHLSDASDAHDASAISNIPSGNLAATEVQAALNELQTDIDTRATSTALSDHLSDATDAHDASAISNVPSGNLAATEVQAALNELQTDIDTRAPSNSPTLVTPSTDIITLDGQASAPANPSAGNYKVYMKDDGKFYSLNSSGIESELGSGSGQGGINYIENSDAETDTTGWVTYADAAGTSPVDGTGGTATGVTFTRSTDVGFILRGDASFALDKDASNRQGKGASYDFTIDHADNGGSKPLYISFDYTTDGTYVSGDVIVYVYNKDAATLQTVVNSDSGSVMATEGSGYTSRFTGRIDSAYLNDDYRLIFHIATTSASAWSLYLDNIQVSPQALVPGAIATDLGTETWADNQGNATTSVRLHRVGSRVYADGITTFTGAMSGGFSVTVPAAYASKNDPVSEHDPVGVAYARDANGAIYNSWIAFQGNTTTLLFYIGLTNSTYGSFDNYSATTPFTWVSTDSIRWTASWQVSGWTSGALFSTSEMPFISAVMRASGDPASASSGNPVIFPTRDYDSLATYNTTTGLYTVLRSGKYRIHGFITSANNAVALSAYVNGSAQISVGQTDSNGECSYSGTVSVISGDTISLRPGGTLDAASGSTFCIEAIPDFSTFSVYESPKPSFSAHRNSATQSINSGSATKVQWTHEEFDTNNNFDNATNYRFTPTVAGKYVLEANISFTVSVDTAIVGIYIYKNGAAYKYAQYHMSTTKAASAHISCIADANGTTDYFEVFAVQDTGGAKNLSGIPSECRFSGSRL